MASLGRFFLGYKTGVVLTHGGTVTVPKGETWLISNAYGNIDSTAWTRISTGGRFAISQWTASPTKRAGHGVLVASGGEVVLLEAFDWSTNAPVGGVVELFVLRFNEFLVTQS